MRAINYVIPVKKRSQKFNLIPIGDTHVGSVNCDEKKLKDLVEWVRKTPDTYVIGMGDMIEAINVSDPRFAIDSLMEGGKEIDNLLYKQIKRVAEILKPIAPKIIGLLEGNHEEKAKKFYHVDATSILCEKLGVQYLTYSALIRLQFKRGISVQNVMVYAHHGFGGGTTVGGKLNKIQKLATNFLADIYLMGHVHDKYVFPTEQLYMPLSGNPVIKARKKVFALTGSFFNTYADGYSSYSEKMAYSPIPTGVIKIQIIVGKKEKVNGKSVDLPPDIHPSA